MNKLRIHHLRMNNKLVGTIAYYLPDEQGLTSYSLTFVSRKDQASRKRGREIATQRMALLAKSVQEYPDLIEMMGRPLNNRRINKIINRSAKRKIELYKERPSTPIKDVYDILNAFRQDEKSCCCQKG